jgi:nickel transport protein
MNGSMRDVAGSCRRYLNAAFAAVLIASAGAASSHEVQHEIVQGNAVVVRLVYADGEPFSYEQYELYAKGRAQPVQSGRTDSRGRVLFASDDTTSWRLRTFSADGHGVDLSFDARADGIAAPMAAESNRGTRLLFGLGVVLAGFAALKLFVQRKKFA